MQLFTLCFPSCSHGASQHGCKEARDCCHSCVANFRCFTPTPPRPPSPPSCVKKKCTGDYLPYMVEYVPAPQGWATEKGDVQKDPAGHSMQAMYPTALKKPSSHRTSPRVGSEQLYPALQAMHLSRKESV